jgi:hypothetical protein
MYRSSGLGVVSLVAITGLLSFLLGLVTISPHWRAAGATGKKAVSGRHLVPRVPGPPC